MICLPDELYLERIKPGRAFFQKDSIERSTSIEKPKYKLSGHYHQEIDVYTFFIITSKITSCTEGLTLKVSHQDWESRESNHLTDKFSYIPSYKTEALNKQKLINVIKKGFGHIATIKETHFSKLCCLAKKSIQVKSDMSNEALFKILLATGDTLPGKDIVKRLNLD